MNSPFFPVRIFLIPFRSHLSDGNSRERSRGKRCIATIHRLRAVHTVQPILRQPRHRRRRSENFPCICHRLRFKFEGGGEYEYEVTFNIKLSRSTLPTRKALRYSKNSNGPGLEQVLHTSRICAGAVGREGLEFQIPILNPAEYLVGVRLSGISLRSYLFTSAKVQYLFTLQQSVVQNLSDM